MADSMRHILFPQTSTRNAERADRETSGPFPAYGAVLGMAGDAWLVSLTSAHGKQHENPVAAARAFSCLIEPLPEDTVLLMPPAAGGDVWHILAVIERRVADAPTSLALPGKDVSISVPDGALRLSGARGMSLEDERSISLSAPVMKATGGTADLSVTDVRVRTGVLQGFFDSVNTVARNVNQVLGVVSQKIIRSQRHVAERDETFAGSSVTMAEDLVSLQGRNARVNAEKNVVVNASKIHMG